MVNAELRIQSFLLIFPPLNTNFKLQSLLYFIYYVLDIWNVQNCVAILILLEICVTKKSNLLGRLQRLL